MTIPDIHTYGIKKNIFDFKKHKKHNPARTERNLIHYIIIVVSDGDGERD